MITASRVTSAVNTFIADMRFARALGARSAAVTWGYVARDALAAEQPTWIVDAPAELLEIAGATPPDPG